MEKLQYSKPSVLSHELIRFETGISNCLQVCEMPDGSLMCIKADGTWEPID